MCADVLTRNYLDNPFPFLESALIGFPGWFWNLLEQMAPGYYGPLLWAEICSLSQSFQWHTFPFGHFTILEFPLSLKGELTFLVFYCVIRLSGWHLPSWWASRTSGMICSLGTLLGVFSVLMRMLEGCWQPLNVFCTVPVVMYSSDDRIPFCRIAALPRGSWG